MGCCFSSPHHNRIYRDPGDLDEEEIGPIRYFGTNRVGSNLVPDDVGGLPSTHIQRHLAANSDLLLYEAEIDHGYACRCCRPVFCFFLLPGFLVYFASYIAVNGLSKACHWCTCDQMCCWLRKEYSTRTFFRVYPNRIVVNYPAARWPFGYFGCGSWNADSILSHPFDRGAFGFQRVKCGIMKYLCGMWPVYGGAVARHRCQCNGPLWNRCLTDCGGWWCDEWLCTISICSYLYGGLANPDEVAFACSIALQAYFEGRIISRVDMDKCIQYWRDNIDEIGDPVRRKREVCCEPFCIPLWDCIRCQRCFHLKRDIPYADDQTTNETREIYERYDVERLRQIEQYNKTAAVRQGTCCRVMGCRRFFGRKGFLFCTEGCDNCHQAAGEPAPPPEVYDLDDDIDASTILFRLFGPPPPNVVIRRWRYDPEKKTYFLETYPEKEEVILESQGEQVEETTTAPVADSNFHQENDAIETGAKSVKDVTIELP
ncbi:hypothetical protein ACA910_021844 [Epithemia clementina (nom. ined.)]